MPKKITRPYSNELTAALAERVNQARKLMAALPDIYLELMYREKKAAKVLRASLAELMASGVSGFTWPDTDVIPGEEKLADGVFVHANGLLGYLGYRVGTSGVSSESRRDLLAYVYTESLPTVNSADYMNEWGKPRSLERLRKLANSIATFTKNIEATARRAISRSSDPRRLNNWPPRRGQYRTVAAVGIFSGQRWGRLPACR